MDSNSLLYIIPVVGYLLGTIPAGLLVGFSRGIDVRTAGSGNIGATNVARVVGRKWGIITLIADMLKGFLPVISARLLLAGSTDAALIVAITGFAAVCGHCFSIFLKFRGGKGVATAVGVFLAVCPWSVLAGFVVFFLAIRKWKIVSVASLLSALVIPPVIHIICPGAETEIMAWGISAVIWLKHKDNIKRLMQGTEASFREKGNETKKA